MPRRSEEEPQNTDQITESPEDRLIKKSFLTGAKTYERADGSRYIVRQDGSIEEDREVKAS